MHFYNLLHAALLSSVAAKPLARFPFAKRQFTNATSSNTITEISAGIASATTACTVTYLPSSDKTCGDISESHGIQLYNQEADYPSDSTNCDTILQGYGICKTSQSGSSGQATSKSNSTVGIAALSPASNATIANNTLLANAPAKATTISAVNLAEITDTTRTTLRRSTYTYALGTGSNTKVTTVVVTHTDTEVFTFTTTITLSGSPSSTPVSASADGLTSTLHATESATSTSTMRGITASVTSATALSSTSASSCTGTAVAPAPTQAGIVTGCTQWYVAQPGDYCIKVAREFDVDVTTFMNWNPAVVRPSCSFMLAGSAYCVATCGGSNATSESRPAYSTLSRSSVQAGATTTTGSTLSTSVSTSATSSAPGAGATNSYVSYTGDGSLAAGWPNISSWITFDSMFSLNQPAMKASCANWGVPNDSDEEIADLKSAIQTVGSASGIDPRFILAIVMQESTGCVRVITTAYSVKNPGLMQSHNGNGSCNPNSAPIGIPGTSASLQGVQTPCPDSEILQMIRDGVQGTSSGDGLQQLFAAQKSLSSSTAMAYYRTARAYNGGSVDSSGNLNAGCCTTSYVQNVANRLTGWVSAS